MTETLSKNSDSDQLEPAPKRLKGKIQFFPSNGSDAPLEWSEDENWEAIYTDSNEED